MKTILTATLALGLICTGAIGCKPHNNDQAGAGTNQPEHLFTRSYKIATATFVGNLKNLAAPKAGESNQQLLIRYFKENNVVIEPPAALLLDEQGNRLLVRASETDKDKIQALFDKIQNGK